jgi:hypothetical protein
LIRLDAGMPDPPPACRSCGAGRLTEILDLGLQPQADAYRDATDRRSVEPRWPLRVLICERCWLAQLAGGGPSEASTPGPPAYELSETMRAHTAGFVEDVLARVAAPPDRLRVIELASHGGYLQPFLARRGVRSIIAEGMPQQAKAAVERGYSVIERAFDPALAREQLDLGGPIDLLLDNYLLAHVVAPDDVAAAIAILLRRGGLAVLEFDHLLPLVIDRRFDAFRHGHFSYLGLTAARALFERHGLVVFDATPQPVYGGALRVFVARRDDLDHPVSPVLDELCAAERRAGLSATATFESFAAGVAAIRDDLRAFLESARARGDAVVGYGAPSRASTLLNYCGITENLLAYTVDRSSLKQGRLMPGCGIPIHEPDAILRTRPAYVLILTWDIKDEVVRQMAAIRAWGGRFVLPIPQVRVTG